MSEVNLVNTESQPLFAGTPVRDLLAGAAAFGVVIIGANLLAHTLKGVMDDSVRTGAVGVLFASVPGVYGVARKIAAKIGPKPLKPVPELAPWYITGLMGGVLLFAWTRFISLLAGMGLGVMTQAVGAIDPAREQGVAQAVMFLLMVCVVPTLFVASIAVGYVLHKNTRAYSILAILLATLALIALDALMTFVVFADINTQLINAANGGGLPLEQWLLGFGIFGVAAIFGLLLGMWSAMLRKERSISGIASLAKRLAPSERDQLDAELRSKIATKV